MALGDCDPQRRRPTRAAPRRQKRRLESPELIAGPDATALGGEGEAAVGAAGVVPQAEFDPGRVLRRAEPVVVPMRSASVPFCGDL